MYWKAYNDQIKFPTVLSHAVRQRYARSRTRAPPMLVHVQVCGIKGLGCQEVSRGCTRGESQDSIVCRWWSRKVRNPSWLWNPEETSPEVQNRGISGLTIRTDVLQTLLRRIPVYVNELSCTLWRMLVSCFRCRWRCCTVTLSRTSPTRTRTWLITSPTRRSSEAQVRTLSLTRTR